MPLNIGGYKFDKKTKTFPVFINYDKSEISVTLLNDERSFIPGSRDRLIANFKVRKNFEIRGCAELF